MLKSPDLFAIIASISVLPVIFSLIIDLIMGDPNLKYHPVMVIGKTIGYFKKRFLRNSPIVDKFMGVFLIILVGSLFLIPLFILCLLIWLSLNQWKWIPSFSTDYGIVIIISAIFGFLLKWTYAIKNLGDTTKPIHSALEEKNIEKARKNLSWIVRRKTETLDETHVISASVECIAESSTDSVTGVFWFYSIGVLLGYILYLILRWEGFIFLGIPSAYLYRIINTADSVVGYKDEENINIGWFSARFDDVANFIPARLTAILMLIVGKFSGLNYQNGRKMLKKYRNSIESINAGWTMSAMAGLLRVQLEKMGSYKLGDPQRDLNPDDIIIAFKITRITVIIFIIISIVLTTSIILLFSWRF